MQRISLLSAVTLAASCAPHAELAVAPDISAPDWQQAQLAGAGRLDDAWTAFGSPGLERLIEQARSANADIAVAAARVIEARGQLGVARAASLPSLDAAGFAGLYADSGPDRRGATADQSLGLNIAYDIDLFGNLAGGRDAARARLAASRFDRDAVALAIESGVARAYIQHAALSQRIDLLERALANARELDRIIGVRVREGIATRVDSGLQTIEVGRIEAEISRFVEARARTRNALAVLVGEEAPLFRVSATLDDLSPPAYAPVQPGLLLVRRPDIKAAEARIAAANGDVAQARAAFLPRLRISSRTFLEAGGGGPIGLVLSAGASLLAPIFAGGRLRGDLLTASGAQLETVETYRKTLLTALGEAEDSLAGIEQSSRRARLLGETMAVARTTARLARRQFVEGAADLQTVLDAERGLIDIEDAAVVARQDRLNAAIDFFQAMGGSPLAPRMS